MSIITTSAHCTAFAVSMHLQARFRGLLDRGASGAQADHDLDAGIAEVVGMREALAAVPDDGDLLAADPLRLDVLFVEDVHARASIATHGTYASEKVNN